MAVTSTDIVNRALQLIGTRTTIASLAESSNEAIQANLVYTAIVNWCFGLANWNFARKVTKLSLAKTAIPPAQWSATSPAPPWLYEYTLPADFIRAQYLTNTDTNSGENAYLGEPRRFVVATDTITAVQQEVILTNENYAILVYTSLVSDPTLWPWLFERLVVSMLAVTIANALTGDVELLKYLNETALRFLSIASQANMEEGLSFGDTTPEWIQALGISYPFRRGDGKPQPPQPPRQGNGDRG